MTQQRVTGMKKSAPGPEFFRELTQGSLSGNLCGLFIDKNHTKTGGRRKRGKKTDKQQGGGSEPPNE